MAAPVTDTVRLPDDRGNLGKLLQAQHELDGSTPIYAPRVIRRSTRAVLGLYYFSSAVLEVSQSAHNGTSTAFFWLENPVGSSVNLRLRQLRVAFSAGSAKVDRLTRPRQMLFRFTFTGTASGAQLSTAKRRTGDPDSTGTVRTASTGMTVALGSQMWAALTPTKQFTTEGAIWGGGPVATFNPRDDEDEYVVLAAGEGVVFGQPDAGSYASDGRNLIVTGCWDEYDAA